jgi:hypothetical protein
MDTVVAAEPAECSRNNATLRSNARATPATGSWGGRVQGRPSCPRLIIRWEELHAAEIG